MRCSEAHSGQRRSSSTLTLRAAGDTGLGLTSDMFSDTPRSIALRITHLYCLVSPLEVPLPGDPLPWPVGARPMPSWRGVPARSNNLPTSRGTRRSHRHGATDGRRGIDGDTHP